MEKFIGRPKVKICGITRIREAEYLNEAKADYAGFVFYEKSRRNLTFDDAARVMERLDAGIKKVAVTVSPSLELVKELLGMRFDILQVHGELRKEVRRNARLPVWRAVNITDGHALRQFFLQEEEAGACRADGYVVDGAGYGAGAAFDWEGLGRSVCEFTKGKTFVLAGGLTEQNVRRGISYFMPDVVDVSSGVEENGKKSREKIKAFIRKARENGQ